MDRSQEYSSTSTAASKNTPPPPPPPQENVQAAAVNTLLRPRTAEETRPPPPQGNVQAAAVETLLTPLEAEEIRRSTRIAGTCKKDMRAFLDSTSENQPRNPDVLAFDLPADLSWKHYIARHPECEKLLVATITSCCRWCHSHFKQV